MKVKESLNEKGQQYHIACSSGEVGRYVLLPGDPFRTDLIAQKLDDAVLVAHNREHKTWTGFLDQVKVSVTSTGMGCPSTAIALEELIHCGSDTFIRIGTAGRLSQAAFDPSLAGVIVTGAVRDEGTTRQYMPIEYPAIANRAVVSALADAAAQSGAYFLEGLAHCKDSYYGQIDPDGLPGGARLKMRWKAWEAGNVLASEMETAALFVISSIRGCRAGAIMSFKDMDQTINIAVSAIRQLIQADAKG